MGPNWPCRSPGDMGKLGLQGQGSGCGLDMESRGHSQPGPYKNPQGRLKRQRGEQSVLFTSSTHPEFPVLCIRCPLSPRDGPLS